MSVVVITGRLLAIQALAPLVAFLLSDDTSYISAANLVIDGGWSAVLPGAS